MEFCGQIPSVRPPSRSSSGNPMPMMPIPARMMKYEPTMRFCRSPELKEPVTLGGVPGAAMRSSLTPIWPCPIGQRQPACFGDVARWKKRHSGVEE